MKKSTLFGGVAALALVAGSAQAGEIIAETYDLGTFTLVGVPFGEPAPAVVFDIDIAGNLNQIVGFGFAGTYSEVFSVSWASDTRLVISGLASYDVGGLSNLENDWDQFGGSFPQGSGSTAPGFYDTEYYPAWADAPIDKSAGGVITLTFTNDWFTSTPHDITWTDATFTIYKFVIPAPGAVALLGLAGLAGTRRRRG